MPSERRRFDRVPETFEVQYRRLDWTGEPWRAVRSLNISASGVRFISLQPLDPGMLLELQLKLPLERGETIFIVKGSVAWSKSVAAGVAELGVQFMDLTLDQQAQIDEFVQFLLKHPRPHPPPDRDG